MFTKCGDNFRPVATYTARLNSSVEKQDIKRVKPIIMIRGKAPILLCHSLFFSCNWSRRYNIMFYQGKKTPLIHSASYFFLIWAYDATTDVSLRVDIQAWGFLSKTINDLTIHLIKYLFGNSLCPTQNTGIVLGFLPIVTSVPARFTHFSVLTSFPSL